MNQIGKRITALEKEIGSTPTTPEEWYLEYLKTHSVMSVCVQWRTARQAGKAATFTLPGAPPSVGEWLREHFEEVERKHDEWKRGEGRRYFPVCGDQIEGRATERRQPYQLREGGETNGGNLSV